MAEITFHYPGVEEPCRIRVEGDIEVRQGLDEQGWVRYEIGALPGEAQMAFEAALARTVHNIHGIEATWLALVKFDSDEQGGVTLLSQENGDLTVESPEFGLFLQSTVLTLAGNGAV